jgi:hypothetical protein
MGNNVIVVDSKDALQISLQKVERVTPKYGQKNSTSKTKTMVFKGRYRMQIKIVINNNFQEQINNLHYIGCSISYQNEKYIIAKISKLLQVMEIINITLKPSQAKKTH